MDGYEYEQLTLRCGGCGYTRGITKDDCPKCGKGREVAKELTGQYQALVDAEGIGRADNQIEVRCTFCDQDYWTPIDTTTGKGLLKCPNCSGNESNELEIDFESGTVTEEKGDDEKSFGADSSAASHRHSNSNSQSSQQYWRENISTHDTSMFDWFRIWHVLVAVGVVALVFLVIWIVKKTNERIPVNATVQGFYWKREVSIEKHNFRSGTCLLKDKPTGATAIRTWDDTKDELRGTGKMIEDKSRTVECPWEDLKNGTRRRKTGPCHPMVEEQKKVPITKKYCNWEQWTWDWERSAYEEGYDRNPRWPKVWLANDERPARGSLESGDEIYRVIFVGDNGVEYPKSLPLGEWKSFNEGAEYTIIVNGWGTVVEIIRKDSPNYK
jgi:hypothetical protein